MSEPQPDVTPPTPLNYEPPQRRKQPVRRYLGGVAVAWFLLFVAMMLGTTTSQRRWGWADVGAMTAACATYAILTRRREPERAAGVWTGLAIGLLHAGWCFSIM